jgi:hypothetical protein
MSRTKRFTAIKVINREKKNFVIMYGKKSNKTCKKQWLDVKFAD